MSAAIGSSFACGRPPKWRPSPPRTAAWRRQWPFGSSSCKAVSCTAGRRRRVPAWCCCRRRVEAMTVGYEPNLLVVDDDPLIREELESLFATQPYRVECVASVSDAMQSLAEREFALALVDVRIAGGDGLALTKDIREHWPDVDVIMITGNGSIKNAVEAMRQGAVDYITKPFQPEELLHATQKALERRRLIDEIEYLRRQLSDRYAFANMVSRNAAMLEIFATLEMLARNDVTVLITGESGTGKELAGRAIHYQGKRRTGRFVAINCAAVPETLMESELFGYER